MSSNIAKNTAYLTIASIGQKILAFTYFIFLARVMQPEQTGAYFLALSITMVFAVVADFGITPVVIREIAKKPESAKGLVQRALGLKVPLFLLAATIAIVASILLNYDPIVTTLVLIATIVMALDAFTLLFYGVLRGHHRLQYESLGIFIGQIATVTFGGLILFFAPSLPFLIGALILGSGFNMGFSALNVSRLLGYDSLKPVFDKEKSKQLLVIALPFALAGIFVKGYSYIDSLLLGKILGEGAVGIYSIAYKFTYAFQFVPLAFVAALYPGLSALVKKRDSKELAKTFDNAIWYMALIGAPIVFGLWAIAPDVVGLAGEGYTAAAPVLATLVFVLIPIFLDFPVGSLLNAADRQKTKTTIMGITLVINATLNVIFIPIFGIIGAAYAALISFSFLFLVGLSFVSKIIKGYRYRNFLRTIIPIFFSAAIMGLVTIWLRDEFGFILAIPIAAVIYMFLLFVTGSVTKQQALSLIRVLHFRRIEYVPTTPHDD